MTSNRVRNCGCEDSLLTSTRERWWRRGSEEREAHKAHFISRQPGGWGEGSIFLYIF